MGYFSDREEEEEEARRAAQQVQEAAARQAGSGLEAQLAEFREASQEAAGEASKEPRGIEGEDWTGTAGSEGPESQEEYASWDPSQVGGGDIDTGPGGLEEIAAQTAEETTLEEDFPLATMYPGLTARESQLYAQRASQEEEIRANLESMGGDDYAIQEAATMTAAEGPEQTYTGEFAGVDAAQMTAAGGPAAVTVDEWGGPTAVGFDEVAQVGTLGDMGRATVQGETGLRGVADVGGLSPEELQRRGQLGDMLQAGAMGEGFGGQREFERATLAAKAQAASARGVPAALVQRGMERGISEAGREAASLGASQALQYAEIQAGQQTAQEQMSMTRSITDSQNKNAAFEQLSTQQQQQTLAQLGVDADRFSQMSAQEKEVALTNAGIRFQAQSQTSQQAQAVELAGSQQRLDAAQQNAAQGQQAANMGAEFEQQAGLQNVANQQRANEQSSAQEMQGILTESGYNHETAKMAAQFQQQTNMTNAEFAQQTKLANQQVKAQVDMKLQEIVQQQMDRGVSYEVALMTAESKRHEMMHNLLFQYWAVGEQTEAQVAAAQEGSEGLFENILEMMGVD